MDKFAEETAQVSADDLLVHALVALRETLPVDSNTVSAASVSLAIVGRDRPFELIEDEARIAELLAKLPEPAVRAPTAMDVEEQPQQAAEDNQ